MCSVNRSGRGGIDGDPTGTRLPLSVLFDLSRRLSSWQATAYPTLGLKPPRQTAALISLIINQYAAGRPLWRGLYPALASVQQKLSEGWRDGGRRKQGHLRLPPWAKHGAVLGGNRWGEKGFVGGGWWGLRSSCFFPTRSKFDCAATLTCSRRRKPVYIYEEKV